MNIRAAASMVSVSERPWSMFAIPVTLVVAAFVVIAVLQFVPDRPGAAAERTLRTDLDRVDTSLAAGDASAALRAWRDAYGSALATGAWDPMLAVADAYLRIGALTGARQASEAKAHEIYLVALVRARRDADLAGILRTAEALAALGDREVVQQSLRLASRIVKAHGDERARAEFPEAARRIAAKANDPDRAR
jgi:hypothetical protein